MNGLRLVRAIILKLALAFLLAACSGGQPPPLPTPAPVANPNPLKATPAVSVPASPAQPTSAATVPVSTQPTPTITLDKAAEAKRLADQLTGAANDQARYEALLAVMRALAIGVYTPDGQAVVSGAERGPRDFYLYDFEVRMMAQSLARQDTSPLEDLASALSEMELRPNDQPLSADAMWAIMQAGTRDSAQKPTDRLSLAPLLIRELGLRKPAPYDTLQAASQDVSFDSLQQFLILVDFALPIVHQVWPLASVPSHLVEDMNGILKPRPVAFQNPCESMVGTIGKEGWGVGKLGLTQIKKISNPSKMALVIIDAIHGSLLAFSVKVQAFKQLSSTHYGHEKPGDPIGFKIKVAMLDELPDVLVKCGWLLGVEFPKKGGIKDVKMLWFYDNLDQHGEIICAEEGCKKTDHDGVATLVFKPKQEAEPYGVGPEYTAQGVLTAVALYQSRHKNYIGTINSILTPKYAVTGYVVTYHKQPEFDLDFQSEVNVAGIFNGSSKANAHVHLTFDPFKGYTGSGTLTYQTMVSGNLYEPRCELRTITGSGTTDFAVTYGQIKIDPSTRAPTQIELYISPGMTGDNEEKSPCGSEPLQGGGFWYVSWWYLMGRVNDKDYNRGGYPVTGWRFIQGDRPGVFAEKLETKTWGEHEVDTKYTDNTKMTLTLTPPQ